MPLREAVATTFATAVIAYEPGLGRIGWVRLSLEDDSNADKQLNFELDTVSVASAAVGESVIPEPSVSTLLCTLIGLLARRHR